MEKELQLFYVEGHTGYDQEWFSDWWMNKGGCGAVTACDCCIYFARYFGLKKLYGGDTDNITKKEDESFAMQMKPVLSPRFSGIDKLEIFVDGFNDYLESVKEDRVKMTYLYADCTYEQFLSTVKSLLDNDMPVPMLVLRHKSPAMKDFVWHWFWLAGYKEFEDTCMVKVISYGEWVWFSLHEIWDTGYKAKGGIVCFEPIEKEG